MMNAQEQIAKILDKLGMKAPTFAKSIGLKYQRIVDISSGKTKKISGIVANAIIAKYPEFNLTWLLTGQGEMLKNITEMSEGSLPAASEHPSMTSSQIKGKVPENVFTGLTQEQVDKELKNGIRDVIMEMYEKGEAYPATIVRQYQDQIKELTRQVARLEYQLQESGLKQTVSAGSLGRTGGREREDESDK